MTVTAGAVRETRETRPGASAGPGSGLLVLASEFPPGPGGIGTHACQLARHWAGLGWGVTVVAPQDYSPDEVVAFNRAQPFPVVRVRPVPSPPLKAAYRYALASRVVRERRPGLVVASGERAVWVAAALARGHRLPLVAVGHGSEFGPGRGWSMRLTRWSFGRADAVVCVSQFTRRLMLGAGVRPASDVVIPNGADDSRFAPLPGSDVRAARDRLAPGAERLLLTVGNVTERKGQEVVIRALPDVLRAAPGTHYLIAGLPTRRDEYASLARRLGVADQVHFLGRVAPDELVRCLNACDVFVMTSRTTSGGDCEGYGIAVVEAALCGRPAVVTRGSGLAEAIVAGETGLAVPEGDPRATAEAIVALLRDEPARRRMGDAARRRALAEQTWGHRAAEYDRLFRAVLNPGTRA